MNSYKKFVPNVWLAKTSETYAKGETIELETRRGKVNEHIIHNLIYSKDGYNYYSITRADGYNLQERARQKSERLESWAKSADKKSIDFWKASNKDSDFLSLGEPIKVGHHSEKRHRRIIQQSHNNMDKCVGMSKKAEYHRQKAEYWKAKENEINLSIPESIEFYEFKLSEAIKRHQGLKDGSIKRDHSFSLTYAKKDVNELTKKRDLSIRLWA